MQISKYGNNQFLIKTKEATIQADITGVDIEGLKFTGPGEYERKGIFVEGVRPDGEGTVFVIHAEEISICFLGKISKPLSNDAVKSLGDIDILFIPFGVDETLKAKDAEKTISVIDPRVVIPFLFEDETGLEATLGVKGEKVDTFKIKKADLPVEDRKLILI